MRDWAYYVFVVAMVLVLCGTARAQDRKIERYAPYIMVAGQAADIATTIAYDGPNVRETSPFPGFQRGNGRPNHPVIIGVKAGLCLSTFFMPKRWRWKAQLGLGIAGFGAATFNVVVRF